ITTQPESQTVQQGTTAILTVAALGPSLTYQWFKNGAIVPGATGPGLTNANVQLTASGNYYVVVSNSFGRVTSDTAVLTVVGDIFPPLLVAATASDTVSNRVDVTFSERLNSASATTLNNYSVRLCDGTSLVATQAQLNVNVVRLTLNGTLKFGTNYWLVVTNVRDASINSNAIAPPDNVIG